MTDFGAREPRQSLPPAARSSPYFDFNDIFGRSAGKKTSPPATTAATAATATNNNNNSVNNNNGDGSTAGKPPQPANHHQSPATGGGGGGGMGGSGCCPVCGMALRTAHELESHFVWELERLYKQAAAAGRPRRRDTPDKLADGHGQHAAFGRDGGGGRSSPAAAGGGGGRDGSLHGRWETYQKVKANRYNRLRIKNRKRKPDEMLLTPTTCACPVCNEPVTATTQEQMNAHVEMCLRNKGHPATMTVTAVGNEEDENVDVEGDSEVTTMYVYGGGGGIGWPQHNRMRHQPMLLHGGGYGRSAVTVANSCGGPDNHAPSRHAAGEDSSARPEDAVLVVDDDDNDDAAAGAGAGDVLYKYGPNQYGERDVIVPSRPPTASSESRRLTPAEQNDANAMETTDSCENVGPLDVSIKKENAQDDGMKSIEKYCGQFTNSPSVQIVEALKARIRELESKAGCDKFTCLLCKGYFKNPVVSTSCWHVYCEVCWLQILGAKKLCPQCYVVTLPSNLRRVYL